MFIIFDLFFILFILFYLPVFIIKKKYHAGFGMRLGFLPAERTQCREHKRPIWLHAVSAGEVNSLKPFVTEIKKILPDERLIISTVTTTGYERACSFMPDEADVIYAPLDISFIVRKAVGAIKPKAVIITETEIWPNFILHLKKKSLPVMMLNGHISASSYAKYRYVKYLLRPVLGKLDLCLMQTETDAERIINLGVPAERVTVTGSTKFDIMPDKEISPGAIDVFRNTLKLSKEQKVLVAASTHYPEERAVLGSFKELKDQFADLKLILAPRHPQRGADVLKEAEALKLKAVLFSSLKKKPYPDTGYDVCILDVMGRLNEAYAVCDVVFLGGSLAHIGGHNISEPAGLGKPVIVGPHTFKQPLISLLESSGAIWCLQAASGLTAMVKKVLNSPQEARARSERAAGCLEDLRGASKEAAGQVAKLLKE